MARHVATLCLGATNAVPSWLKARGESASARRAELVDAMIGFADLKIEGKTLRGKGDRFSHESSCPARRAL